MKKILIISYYWPPSGGVGVQRWLFFANFLKEQGYEVIVYTPSNPQFDITDNALLKKAEGIRTIKSEIWEPYQLLHFLTGGGSKKHVKQGLVMEKKKKGLLDGLIVWLRANLLVPDPRVFWVNKSVKLLTDLIKKENIDLMITTSPPHSMQVIGEKIKRKTGVKWIADFRDPWSFWDVLDSLGVSGIIRQRHKNLERKVFQNSDKVFCISERLKEEFLKLYDMPDKIEVVYNGVVVNDEMLKDIQAEPPKESVFNIGYFGMLQGTRNPKNFLKALDSVSKDNNDFKKSLRIRFAGIIAESNQDLIENEFGWKEQFINLGYLEHKEVQFEYKKSQILLLILNQNVNAQWILPMKFFEYISAGVPILALGPEQSDLRKIMDNYSIGEYIEYEDVDGMKKFINDVYQGNYKIDQKDRRTLLETYSKQASAKQVVSMINEMN